MVWNEKSICSGGAWGPHYIKNISMYNVFLENMVISVYNCVLNHKKGLKNPPNFFYKSFWFGMKKVYVPGAPGVTTTQKIYLFTM